MVISTNEIPTILHLFWEKKETTGKTKQYYRKTKFQLKLVKWSKKNANSRSHLRKINEKIRKKLARHTSHSLMQLPAKSSLLSRSFAHKINDKVL